MLTNVKDKDKPEDRQGAVYKIKCCDCQASYIGETGRNLSTRLTEHKRATRNGDVNNHIAEHHLQTKHQIDWDSATCITYSTDYHQRLTLESWFTNLEQTPLNRSQQLPAPYKRLIRDLKQTLEAVRWRRRWPRGSGLRPPPLGAKLEYLSWRGSGDELRLFYLHFKWSNLTLFVNLTCQMATFREVRDLLAFACFEDIIDEDEFLLMWELNTSKNLDFPYEDYGRFDLDEMDDSECVAEFRVKKHDLPDLAAALQIPNQFVCHQRSVADGMEGLCMLLRRLSYPCRYSDIIARFGRPVPVMSMVTNTVLDYIFTTHSHRILQWNQAILQPAELQTYADTVSLKGAALNNCFGFIDGTVRPICRPGEHQRVVYNGHKRVHALKFQSIALPNGLIANMYGPVGK